MKKQFQRLNMGGPAPRCPLCLEWMEKEYEHVRGFFIFTCVKDKIACRVDDPFVGRWDEALKKSDKKILCLNPRCDETPMRYFATQIGFMKAKCPKCGATLSNAEPDRPKDTVHTPEKPGVLQ